MVGEERQALAEPASMSLAHVNYVRVNASPGVVGQVEAQIVRILIDHDRIGIPEPVSHVRVVLGRDAKVRTSEPEAGWTAALQPKHMTRPEPQRKASMFPWMVQMIAPLVAAHIVTHPLPIAVHMGRIGMSLLVAKIRLAPGALDGSLPLFGWPLLLDGSLLSLPLFRSPLWRSRLPCSRSWTAGWNISAANVALISVFATTSLLPTVAFLRNARNCKTHREQRQKYYIFLHLCLHFIRRAPQAHYLSIKRL